MKTETLHIRVTDMEKGLKGYAYLEALDFRDVPDNRATRASTPVRMRGAIA